MLNLAVKSDDYVIRHNPLGDIKALKEQPAVDRTLSLDEYYKLLAAAPEYFRRIIFFACNTGMRKNEIVGLTFGQIKLRTLGMEIELVETKSGKREYVPLNSGCQELTQQIAGELRINLHKLPKKHLASYVFLHETGRHFRDYRRSMEKSFAGGPGAQVVPYFPAFLDQPDVCSGQRCREDKRDRQVGRPADHAALLPHQQCREV